MNNRLTRLLAVALILPAIAAPWQLGAAEPPASPPQSRPPSPPDSKARGVDHNVQFNNVQFNRDVRPILSDKCFECHGPDGNQRQAELRLDQKKVVFEPRDGYSLVVPGDVPNSELIKRVTSSDPDYRMPPSDAARQLTVGERQTLVRWVEQGAPWQAHWAFIPPARPPIPSVEAASWPHSPIDNFVLARLEQQGWQPSPQTDPATLARRVSLDLTGLPPEPQDVATLLANPSLAEYEKLVDRLLESPRYGERMASIWMDAARYADTSGYQNDGPRYMWRWRDWVIQAYNSNLPFDQFTIDQLAGDMLPHPTLEQRIATGFNRNHRGNAEGGIIPEEYAVEYVVDRVETTSTVWLGLTVGCARCHDHKFDPIRQTEFYQLFAYFNNIPEDGRAIKEGNSPPYIPAPTPDQQQQIEHLDQQIERVRHDVEQCETSFEHAQLAWEQSLSDHRFRASDLKDATASSPAENLLAHFPLDGTLENTVLDATDVASESLEAETGETETAEPRFGKALLALGRALHLDGKTDVSVGDIADFGYFDEFTISAWVKPASQQGTIVSRMEDDARAAGYYVRLEEGRIQVNLVKRWLDDAIRVETSRVLSPDQWYHLSVRYDGSRVAEGITVRINGQVEPLDVSLDSINQTFRAAAPVRIGSGGGPEYRFAGAIDDMRIYARALDDEELTILSVPQAIPQILNLSASERSEAQQLKLRHYFLRHHAPAEFQVLHERLHQLEKHRKQLLAEIPTVMVMKERPEPRPAYVLLRGQYDQPQEQVDPGLPQALQRGSRTPQNRLELARWIVSDDNPLTARVAVNRLWQQLFGTGLVRTLEDFGSQGELPSHPELLDWLAVEYRESGWDTKAMLKKMVMSATYRQSSQPRPNLIESGILEQDPQNRMLARGPRIRLSAQMIRDQALAASGLLSARLGGASVRPYQPEGLWKEIATDVDYRQSTGADLYRRSLYTYWKRTVAPPNMVAFDATDRETCVVRTTRTNTPLQALTLMNDTTYVEAARALAQRVTAEFVKDEERLERAVRLLLVRTPGERERKVLLAALAYHRSQFQQDPAAAEALLEIGELPTPPNIAPAELAAWTMVTTTLLNLDETVTKQ